MKINVRNVKTQSVACGFTLIELMIVIAIIGILVAGVFRLLSTTGEKNKETTTIARLERIQNALSAYYAEYGSYPPVLQYDYPDPEKERDVENSSSISDVTFSSDTANRAAHAQSMAFEFPPVKELDEEIDRTYNGSVRSAGVVLGSMDLRSKTDYGDWHNVQLFKFGLMSYLLPKAHIAWGEQNESRYNKLFESLQWTKKNPDKVGGIDNLVGVQKEMERKSIARWLPNFEKMICNGPDEEIMGVYLKEKDTGLGFTIRQFGGTKFVVRSMTVRDGWNRELYYYSPAPYQTYRIWSSGSDGKTFPPWIPIDSNNTFKQAAAWIEDDIVRFDR